MRRRIIDQEFLNKSRSETDVSISEKVTRFLPKLDVYPKLEEEYRIRTSSGAILSFIMAAFTLLLFVSETYHFLSPKLVDVVEVDNTVEKRMRIDLNVSFLALPCSQVNLIAMDVAGEHQLNMVHDVHKTRLDMDGNSLGEAFKSSLNEVEMDDDGEDNEDSDDDDDQGKQINEGCNITGWLTVNKVAGNFHVALGKTRVVNGRLIHAFSTNQLQHYNSSHVINHISFGPNFSEQSNPLNGLRRIIDPRDSSTGVYQYYLKVVPTLFTESNLFKTTSISSCQYSFTEKFIPIGEASNEGLPEDPHHSRRNAHKHESVVAGLPGVFFIYDMSPFIIHRNREAKPFRDYLARLCAIVGGLFTVSGIIDRMITNFTRKK
eukprot:g71.t1